VKKEKKYRRGDLSMKREVDPRKQKKGCDEKI